MAEKSENEEQNLTFFMQIKVVFTHLESGLCPFSERFAKDDHESMIERVKSEDKFPCQTCNLPTLNPSHRCIENKRNKEVGERKGNEPRKVCELGNVKCNCIKHKNDTTGGCPVCGVLYTEIVKRHSNPPPFWENTDITKWCTDFIEIMKCFINAQGHKKIKAASELDIFGLLQYMKNNKNVHSQLKIMVDGSDVCSRILQRRNNVFHGKLSELSQSDVDSCIDDAIGILKLVPQTSQTSHAIDSLTQMKDTADMVLSNGKRVSLVIKKPSECLIKDLATFYRERWSTLQISPTRSAVDAPMKDIYVHQKLYQVKVGPFVEKHSDYRKEVKSYRDIFLNCKNIYLSADSGFGKTAFIKRLALTWCQAHVPKKNVEVFFEEDLYEMKKFDILFIIDLADSSPDVSDIDEMIQLQIIDRLSKPSQYQSGNTLENILHQGNCLIILDSLEKWSGKECSIPRRKAREHCTITTATSSLESVKGEIGSSKCDKLIEIAKMDEDAANKLITNVLKTSFPDISEKPDKLSKTCADIRQMYWSENTEVYLRYIRYRQVFRAPTPPTYRTYVPGDTGDINEDVETKLLNYAKKAKIDLSPSDIDKVHRLGKWKSNVMINRRVIVKFTISEARQRIYKARKTLPDEIFVQESLTRKRKQLTYEARQLQREDKLIKTWVAGANIYGTMKTNAEEIKVQIRSMEAIDKIRDVKNTVHSSS